MRRQQVSQKSQADEQQEIERGLPPGRGWARTQAWLLEAGRLAGRRGR